MSGSRLLLLFVPFFALTFPCFVRAQLLAPASLYSMSLEELMQVEVTVASKVKERVKEASSSVTVFTRDEIRAMGVDNIYDLLNYVPGIQVTRSVDIVDEPLIHVRGRAHIDGDVLVLLNGHRLNENSFGRATLVNRFISSDLVQRVEVIRGPGSALYGSNAFLAVVNIVTVDNENSGGLEVGRRDRIGGHLNLHRELPWGLGISGSISWFNDDGQDYRIEPGLDTSDPRHNLDLTSRLTWGGLTLDLAYMEYKDHDFITFNDVAPEGRTWSKSRFYLASMGYHLEPAPRLTVDLGASYARQRLEVVGLFLRAGQPFPPEDFYVGPNLESSYYEGTMDCRYDLASAGELLFGAAYRWDGIDFLGAYSNYMEPPHRALIPKPEYYLGHVERFKDVDSLDSREKFLNVTGLYAEYKARFLRRWQVVVGGRWDHYSVVGESFNPRASLQYQATPRLLLKAFYGTAFRVPTTQELFTDSPRSKGNRNLDPERVETVELVGRYSLPGLELEAVWFHNYIHDIIENEIGGAADGRNTWINHGSDNLEGVETRAVWQAARGIRIYLTYTHLLSRVEENSYRDFASYIVDLRRGRWRLNLNGIFRIQEGGTLKGQDDYLVSNLKLSYGLRRGLRCYCVVTNAFDTDYYTYENKLTRLDHAVPNPHLQWRVGIEKEW